MGHITALFLASASLLNLSCKGDRHGTRAVSGARAKKNPRHFCGGFSVVGVVVCFHCPN